MRVALPSWQQVVVGSILGLLVGCSPSKPDTSETTPVEPSSEIIPVSRGSGPDEKPLAPAVTLTPQQRLLKFGRDWAEAMSNQEAEPARNAWDEEHLFRLALGETATRFPEVTQALLRAYRQSEQAQPGGVMWQAFGEPWEVLRYHEVHGQPRLMCRAVVGGGLTYVDLVPLFDRDGEPRLVDAYLFSSGEYLSETLRRGILPQMARATGQPIEALVSGQPGPLLLYFDQIISFLRSAAAQEHGEVIDKYQTLPKSLREEKFLLIQYLGAIIFQMDQTGKDPRLQRYYHDGMLDFEVLYGDDPAYLLMAMEYHLFKEDYDAALEAINRLDEAVGGDPYLDALRANVYAAEYRLDEAAELAIRAREQAPWVEDTYWRVLDLHFRREDWTGAAAEMDRLVKRFSYRFEIESEPYYQAFLRTEVGQKWLAAHQAVTDR